eukprot:5304780-Lingulodinium_polyedra.AAC.1
MQRRGRDSQAPVPPVPGHAGLAFGGGCPHVDALRRAGLCPRHGARARAVAVDEGPASGPRGGLGLRSRARAPRGVASRRRGGLQRRGLRRRVAVGQGPVVAVRMGGGRPSRRPD